MERNGLKQILLCQSSVHAPIIPCWVRDVHFMFSNKNYCFIRFHSNGLYNSLPSQCHACTCHLRVLSHTVRNSTVAVRLQKQKVWTYHFLLVCGMVCAVLVLAYLFLCVENWSQIKTRAIKVNLFFFFCIQ